MYGIHSMTARNRGDGYAGHPEDQKETQRHDAADEECTTQCLGAAEARVLAAAHEVREVGGQQREPARVHDRDQPGGEGNG